MNGWATNYNFFLCWCRMSAHSKWPKPLVLIVREKLYALYAIWAHHCHWLSPLERSPSLWLSDRMSKCNPIRLCARMSSLLVVYWFYLKLHYCCTFYSHLADWEFYHGEVLPPISHLFLIKNTGKISKLNPNIVSVFARS